MRFWKSGKIEKYREHKRKEALQNMKLSGCFAGGKPVGIRFFYFIGKFSNLKI